MAMARDFLIPIFFRPKLLLSAGTTGEYRSDLTGLGNSLGTTFGYNFFRMKIENKSSATTSRADGVYLRILNVYKDNTELEPFNTMMMRWVSNTFSEDLSRGEHLFVNLVTICQDENGHRYAYPGHMGGKQLGLSAGFPEDKLDQPGDFSYRIGVYGKRLNGRTYIIKFHFEPNESDSVTSLTLEDEKNLK